MSKKFLVVGKGTGEYNSGNPITEDNLLEVGGTATATTAKIVQLYADAYVITYDSTGAKFPTNQSITLTASAQNHAGNIYYEFIVDGISKQNSMLNSYTLPIGNEPAAGLASNWTVKTREGDNTSGVISQDTISVYGIKNGQNGSNGLDGTDGVNGTDGQNGQTTYFHVAYADTINGGGFSQSPTDKAYIGTYVDFTQTDSSTPSDYNWVLVKGSDGENGENGIAGTNGINGETSYLHIAYATNSTGSSGFSTTVSLGKTYIGQYTDFTLADSTNYNDYTWTLIKGADGSDGSNGTDGYTVLLTNESHTLAATTTGTVLSYNFSGTSIIVYKGTTKLTGTLNTTPTAGQYSVDTTVSNGTITVGTESIVSGDTTYGNHSNMTTDTAMIKYVINVENIGSFTKYQSLVKSKKGDKGDTGAAGADGINGGFDGKKTTVGFVYYSNAQTTTPSTPSATSYNLSTHIFTGLSANWSTNAPTATGGSDYWYSKYTVEESSAGTNTGTPTFTTPQKHLAFTQLVTFTNLNTVGQTVINGGNITTGQIKSTNYVTGTAPYSGAGTLIDLSNGTITSKNFGINSSGNAYFKGAISGSTFTGGSLNIGTGSFTVDSLGNVYTKKSLTINDSGALNIGNNGLITAVKWGADSYTFYTKEGIIDNSGGGSSTDAGRFRFNVYDAAGNSEMYSNKTLNVGGSASYELITKARGTFLWYPNNSTTHYMSLGTDGHLRTTGNITAYFSDERLKTKQGNIEDPLEKLKMLNGFYYTNNTTANSFGYTDEKLQVGLSAQEVQSILPEVVEPAPFDIDKEGKSKSGENYLTVDYSKIVPLLVEGIKALTARVEELEKQLNNK